MGYITNLEVSEGFLNATKKILGYPIVDEEISVLITDEQIKNLIIEPCMETFCNYFPKVEEITVPFSGGVSTIDAPENSIALVHSMFIPSSSASRSSPNLNSGNPFYTSSQVVVSTRSTWGTPFDYGNMRQNSYLTKFYNKSQESMNKVWKVDYNESTNKLTLQSSISGSFSIKVGTYYTSTNEVPKRFQKHFNAYCQGSLGKHVASALTLMNADLPLSLNADDLLDIAEGMIESEMEYFTENSTIQVLR